MRNDHPLTPSAEEIKLAREDVNLTQKEAGELVHTCSRTWQRWEAGDRTMHPAFWELFRIKSAQYKSNK